MLSKNTPALDLYSTSQTKRTRDFDFGLPDCINHAPYFAYRAEGKHYAVTQGNCHDWTCPRCGIGRAKKEYWRIVNGCTEIIQQNHELYFITITTRGAGLSVAEAQENYLLWTNRFFTNLRTFSARHGGYWCYVQVTERQKRRHPHSHILTTFNPLDTAQGYKSGWKTVNSGLRVYGKRPVMRSERIERASVKAGLGEQYDISLVKNEQAVARYVGKYLFKSSLLTQWPEGWRRVRYSHNWPKETQEKTDAWVLLKREDWYQLATCAETITCTEHDTAEMVKGIMWAYPVKVREKIDKRTQVRIDI